ncbi:MAG: hypothetical protein ACRDNK_20215 [Solirubrobacteraceae bacterium]
MRLCESAGGRRRLLGAAVGVLALAVPALGTASASAATINVTQACYVNANPLKGAPIAVAGSGFTPGDTIEIEGQGVFATTTASPTGQILVGTGGPILSTKGPAAQSFTLTANDQTNPAGNPLAMTTVRMANLSVATTPAVARPTRKVTWHFSGFTPGKTIWVHYLHKRVVNRTSFGKAKGPCGMLSAKRKFYPGGHPHFAKYTVVIDQVKRYTKRARPRIVTTLSFF